MNFEKCLYMFILLAACCSQQKENPGGTPSKSATIEAIIEEYAEKEVFSGAALVYENGKVLLKKAAGLANQDKKIPNTPSTVFSMGSVSKLFTFGAVLMERDRGALKLEDTLDLYIPDYPQAHRITISHLLFHMSGIVDLFNDFQWNPNQSLNPITLEHLIERFKHHPLEIEPGSRVEYSNSGYVLLAYIVEQTSGMSFKKYVEEKMFASAGMTRSLVNGDRSASSQAVGYRQYEENSPYPEVDPSHFTGCGSLFTTVEDLLQWHKHRPTAKDTLHACAYNAAYGQGYGYRGAFVPIPSLDMVIILLSNFIDAPMEEIVARISTVLLEDKVIDLEPDTLKRYIGSYQARAFGLINHRAEIEVEKDHLKMTIHTTALQEPRISTLHPLSSSRFVSKHGEHYEGILITFHKDEQGRVNRITTDLHGFVFDAMKKR